MQAIVLDYFGSLFSDGTSDQVLDVSYLQSKLNDYDIGMLNEPFSMDEFHRAIFDMHPKKAA